ncbi:phage integrase SAM-like domain-containing protein [Paracoccaceae bacterium]|nr:site-specific integrase [Paracoccaceae bacterium]MDC0869218.1 phage integrase SAM-like domain-containing protein [Paracoccaceae bacterium]
MSKKLEKLYLVKNGGTKYYLMFHIKAWMRELPSFKKVPPSKKNHKESLRTSDLAHALTKMHEALARLNLCIDPNNNGELVDRRPIVKDLLRKAKENDLVNRDETEAYFYNLSVFGALSAQEFEDIEETAQEWFHASLDEDDPENNKKIARFHRAQLAAIKRIKSKEDEKLDPAPHPYEVTLEFCKAELLERYSQYGKDIKQKGKLQNAVKKFLQYLRCEDIELKKITRKYVKRYIDNAASQQIPYNTLYSELVHLRSVWKHAVDEELIPNLDNPFYGHDLKYLKKPLARAVYEQDLVEDMILSASKKEEIFKLILLSWYTGARVSEIFNCKVVLKDNIPVFSLAEDGGKTEAAQRFIPIHPALQEVLNKMKIMPEYGQQFDWVVKTSNALEKRFLRFKEKFLVSKNLEHRNKELVHHSFRHTFITLLLNEGLNELQVATLTGQSKKTIGQTEAVKTYYRGAGLTQKLEHICLLPALRVHPK